MGGKPWISPDLIDLVLAMWLCVYSYFAHVALNGRVATVSGLPAGVYTLTIKKPVPVQVDVVVVQATHVLALGGARGADTGSSTEVLLSSTSYLVREPCVSRCVWFFVRGRAVQVVNIPE